MSFPTNPVSQQTQQKAKSLPSQEAVNMDKRIERLFLRLGAIYGHLWSSNYKTEEFIHCTKQEWREGLYAFDNATLGKALAQCREQESYPPSLPKFIEICKALVKRDHSFSRANETETLRCDPAIARMHLANIRAMLTN